MTNADDRPLREVFPTIDGHRAKRCPACLGAGRLLTPGASGDSSCWGCAGAGKVPMWSDPLERFRESIARLDGLRA